MRRTKPSGLVISGQLAETTLLRLPALTEDLGPVAASSKRLASRYANTLRRGWAAANWGELSASRIIYLQVPAAELSSTLEALMSSVHSWHRRVAVLLDDALDSNSLAPLERAGAHVASLTHAPLTAASVALVEGDAHAVSCMRKVLRRSGVKFIHLRDGAKDVYNAGMALGASLAGVVADMSIRAVRLAGVDPATARRIVNQSVDTALMQAPAQCRSAWAGRRSNSEKALLLKQLSALEGSDPVAGAFLWETITAALQFYGADARWLRKPRTAGSGGSH